MMKNGQVEGCTEVAPVLQHARAALPVCASAVKSVVSQIAAAKPAPTSPGTQKYEFKTVICFSPHPFICCLFRGIIALFNPPPPQ